MTRILYVAYWGLREPLGRSLILPAIERLAAQGTRIRLLTFEKPDDLRDTEGLEELRGRLAFLGVEWKSLRYHKRPVLPATAFDVLAGIAAALGGPPPHLVHGRTFIGGVIGWIVARLRGAAFVYHNEGFWPDQQVEGGFWPAGGLLHRVTKAAEVWLYGHADGLVLLSERSKPIVDRLPEVLRRKPPVVVVPSCVDLSRFRCQGDRLSWSPDRPVRLVYLGSLGGRYLIEPLGHFLSGLQRRGAAARLTILSPSDPAAIAASLRATAPDGSWTIDRVAHEEVPGHLCQAHAGLFFLRGGIGAESCSPTKVGEYWACGLPVVMNTGIGDLDDVVRRQRVGVVVRGLSPAELEDASRELLELLVDPATSERCRSAAEEHYSLEAGVQRQAALYERLAGGPSPNSAA